MNAVPDQPRDVARRDSSADLSGALHRRLASFNSRRLNPCIADAHWRENLQRDLVMSLLEGQFIESERRAAKQQADAAPTDPDAFMAWFESLRETGPGQNEGLFDWLANSATLPDMRWFLQQEVASEAGFDELIALTQLRMPVGPKLEMVRTFRDEPASGGTALKFGPMLERTAAELSLVPGFQHSVWEALALTNLMLGLAANRRYAYQSVGALGAVELTAPSRMARVDAGLARLGVSVQARSYFALHASDPHSHGWNAQVIRPLIAQGPDVQRSIAEGALLRLRAGARCFDRYRRALFSVPAQFGAGLQSPYARASGAPVSFR